MWAWHNVAGRPERFYMKHAYWGPEYPDSVMRKAAEAAGFPVHQLSRAELPDAAARLIRSVAEHAANRWASVSCTKLPGARGSATTRALYGSQPRAPVPV